MFEQIMLIGNLTADPELRYTPSGDAVCNFSMATNRKWTTAAGEKQEQVTWWRITSWGKQGEAINTYLSKGNQVQVVGRMNPDKDTGNPRIWNDHSGEARASYEINASTVNFLQGGTNQAEGRPSRDTSSRPPATRPDEIAEDEIPF